MYKRMLILTYEMENNKVLSSIKKGFMQLAPILLVGALALVIKSFPMPAVQNWLASFCGGAILDLVDVLNKLSFQFMSIYLTIGVSYFYSRNFNDKNEYVTILNIILSIFSVLCCLGFGSKNFTYALFGTTGVFTAIIISIISTKLFFMLFQKISAYVYRQSEQPDDIDFRHLSCLIAPFLICAISFFALNRVLNALFHINSINEVFSLFFQMLFQAIGNNLFSGLLLVMLESVLWFFGVHGGNALESAKEILFQPSASFLNKSFLDVFCLMGGCGAAMCLLIALILGAKFKKNRKIAMSSIFPILFNVNEPLVFGLPIVYNLILLIPFLFVPVVSFFIAYFAVCIGVLPETIKTVEWTMPIFFSGYLATGSVAGPIVQLISLTVGTIIYMPFVRMLEFANEKGKLVYIDEMETIYKRALAKNEEFTFLNRDTSLGHAAEVLVAKLKEDIVFEEITIYYQPQMNTDNTIYGAEALLRWRYKGKTLFPPLVVQLAREAGMEDDLSLAIVKRVCEDAREINSQRDEKLMISINISAKQLNDADFVMRVIEIIEYHGVAQCVNLEVTEEMSLANMENVSQNIDILEEIGIGVAMDDFSMGHTSLKYLQKHHFTHVKLDGELVKNMLENSRTREILSSIIALGQNLDFKIIAEFVDSEEKKQELIRLGCDYLQGYLYSPAIPKQEFIEFSEKFAAKFD